MEEVKIEDLMIGDIVNAVILHEDDETGDYEEEKHPAVVTDISPNCHLWVDGQESYFIAEYIDDCKSDMMDSIEPIPLTDDILDKNGWVKEPVDLPEPWGDGGNAVKGYKWLYGGRELLPLSLMEMCSGGSTMYFVMGLQSDNMCVHELQHALRLYGYKELANNFKV